MTGNHVLGVDKGLIPGPTLDTLSAASAKRDGMDRYGAVLPLVSHPHRMLRERSAPVGEITPAVRELARDMHATLRHYGGLGLSAVQVGRPVRLVVTRVDDQTLFLVDPEIVERSTETSQCDEGCLSVPKNYHDVVERPARVRVRARDMNGRPMDRLAGGLLATVIQHEVDHLDGILFIDRLARPARRRAERVLGKLR
jgi:peptide deformylase